MFEQNGGAENSQQKANNLCDGELLKEIKRETSQTLAYGIIS